MQSSPSSLPSAASASSSSGGATGASSACVTVLTRDGVSFVVEAPVALQSSLLQTLMEGAGGSAEAVPLPYVSSATLQLVLSFYRAAHDASCRIADGWNMSQLCDVLLAADYLSLERLLSYACVRVASSITACKDLASLRGLFGLTSDLPEADEKCAQRAMHHIFSSGYIYSSATEEPAASAPVEPTVVADVLYRLATCGHATAAALCVYLCTATASYEGLCASVHHVQLAGRRTHLIVACMVGDIVRVEWWLKCGADVNAMDWWHSTALHEACGGLHESLVLRLIHAGADVNATDVDGGSPLRAARRGNCEALVSLLLAHGAHLPPPAAAYVSDDDEYNAQDHRDKG